MLAIFINVHVFISLTTTLYHLWKIILSCLHLPTLWHHQSFKSGKLKMRIPMPYIELLFGLKTFSKC